MAEEKETIQNDVDVTLGGQEKGQEDAQGKEQEPDKDKQKLDSALGRITGMQSKIDGQDAKFSSLDEKLETIVSTLQTMATPRTEAISETDYTQDADFMPSTKEELRQTYQGWRAEEIKADRDYSDAYMKQIAGLAKGEEKETHDAVVKEMMDNFNVRHSNDGLMDADLNYSKASRSYFKKQLGLKDKTNPLTGPDGDKPPLGGGLGGEEMIEQGQTVMPKLDQAATDFIKHTGMSEEKVKAALKGETPLSLRQNERIG